MWRKGQKDSLQNNRGSETLTGDARSLSALGGGPPGHKGGLHPAVEAAMTLSEDF